MVGTWGEVIGVKREMTEHLGPIDVAVKSGAEQIHRHGEPLDLDVLSFWRWSASNLLSNAMRGIFAEYLVARAVEDTRAVRAEWEPFDVVTKRGVRIEVKSSAYLQSWHQYRLSQISFGIGPTRAWDAGTNTMDNVQKRQADVYVFCVLAHREKTSVDPLNVAQWRFFVISSTKLNAELGNQRSITLSGLQKIGAEEATYEELPEAVHGAAA